MKTTDYTSCAIFGWMVREYGLSGISLIIYSILYSTSQGSFTRVVDWDFIKLCTGLKPKEAELFLNSFKERGMIEFDGFHYKTIDRE